MHPQFQTRGDVSISQAEALKTGSYGAFSTFLSEAMAQHVNNFKLFLKNNINSIFFANMCKAKLATWLS